MPAVPFSVLADPPFAVVEDIDVARAFVAAAERRLGRAGQRRRQRRHHRAAGGPPRPAHPDPARRPGLGDRPARSAALLGAPIPDHVLETLHRGRLADNGRMEELLGFTSATTTVEVIDRLYAWPTVVRTPGPEGGGVTDTDVRVPGDHAAGRAHADGGPPHGGVGDGPPGRRGRRRGTSTTGGATPTLVAGVVATRPRCAGTRSIGGVDRLPVAGRRADRRQHPPLRRWPRSRPPSPSPARPVAPVRFVGRPDIAPIGALARRLGGLLARPDEVAGALRAGELLVMSAPPTLHPRRVGRVDHRADRRRGGDAGRGVPGGHGELAVRPVGAHRDRPGDPSRAPSARPADRARAGRPGRAAHPAAARRVRRRRRPARRSTGCRCRGWAGADVCRTRRAADGTRIHYQVTGRRSGATGAADPGPRGRQARLGPAAAGAWRGRYRTIALDNRGAGRSDKPHGTYSLEQMAADAIAVLDDAGVETRPRRRGVDGRGDRPDPRR